MGFAAAMMDASLQLCYCFQVGWKHQEAVKELEEVRKARSKDYYAAKKKLQSLKTKAVATVEQA